MFSDISTPHGKLKTLWFCGGGVSGVKISTPHGKLKTEKVFQKSSSLSRISTPHGKLKTAIPITSSFVKISFLLHTVN